MRQEIIENAISDLHRSSRDIAGCALVSVDGQTVASSLQQGVDPDRVAAMSAAVLRLGEEAARGLGCGALDQVMLKGESGYVLLMGGGKGAVLSVITNSSAKLGLVLQGARRAVPGG